MPRYRVTTECWMEDSAGRNALRREGDEIELTDAQAEYLRLTGQIERVPVFRRFSLAATPPAATDGEEA